MPPGVYSCKLCGRTFADERGLKPHGFLLHGLRWPVFRPHTDFDDPERFILTSAANRGRRIEP